MKTFVLVFATAATVLVSPAHAQHADIRPAVVAGRLVTGGYEDSTGIESPGRRVFGYDFGEDPAQPYFTQDPGFNAVAGSDLPGGSQLMFNIVAASSLSLPANLSYWNGIGEVAFTPTPADETLRLNFGSQNAIAGDETNGVPGFSLQTVTASGAVHRHLNAFLESSSGDPTAGIYLVPLELASSDAAVQKSLPFFVVYNNGLPEASHHRAIDWVQQSLVNVPEPSGAFLISVVLTMCGGLQRRRWISISANL